MKKVSLLLLIGIILSLFYILDGIYHQDRIDFLSPIKAGDLRIRNDSYGEGHFGAPRKNGRIHKGIDIAAPLGTLVRAAKSGWAVAKFDQGGYGKYVKIYHGGNLITLYSHLADTEIKWIKKVRQGEVIGQIGKTGNARYRGIEPHLHFEVRLNGVPVDPQKGYLE